MERGKGIGAGMTVLAAGIIALASQLGDPEPPATAAPVTVSAPTTGATVTAPEPGLAGVPETVSALLFERGQAEVADGDDLEGVTPAVRRVLSLYSAPLRIAVERGGS